MTEPGRPLVDISPVMTLPHPVVEVRGEIDIRSAPWLRDELLRIIRRRGPCVAVDLSGVTFMDCAGINVLLATRRRARLEGGWLQVIRPSPAAGRLISLLGLHDVLTRDDNERRSDYPGLR